MKRKTLGRMIFLLSSILLSNHLILLSIFAPMPNQSVEIELDWQSKHLTPKMTVVGDEMYVVWESRIPDEWKNEVNLVRISNSGSCEKVDLPLDLTSGYNYWLNIGYFQKNNSIILTWVRYMDNLLASTEIPIGAKTLSNPDLIDSSLSSAGPPYTPQLFSYAFCMNEGQYPITTISRETGFRICYNMSITQNGDENTGDLVTNHTTFFHQLINGINNDTFSIFFDSSNGTEYLFYSKIKDKTFTPPRPLPSLMSNQSIPGNSLSSSIDRTGTMHLVFADSNHTLYLTDNRTGVFPNPMPILTNNLSISTPEITFFNSSRGYMTYGDSEFRIHVIQIDDNVISRHRIFENQDAPKKPYVCPNLELYNDGSVLICWRKVLESCLDVRKGWNSLVAVRYFGGDLFSNLIFLE